MVRSSFPALSGFAGNDDRTMRAALHQQIELVHHKAAHLGCARVASETVLLQDGRNIRVEVWCRGVSRHVRKSHANRCDESQFADFFWLHESQHSISD